MPFDRNLLRSLLHNIGVVFVGFVVAFIGVLLDRLLGFREFHSTLALIAGAVLLLAGFLLRVWATYDFYRQQMKVISLEPQSALIESGAYAFSRNPLYLGGNVFIFFGAALVLGSPSAIVITALHILLVDLFIRREEMQLERKFGPAWTAYKNRVRRWM